MHVTVRGYSGQGASELFDALEQNEDAVKDLIGSVVSEGSTVLQF